MFRLRKTDDIPKSNKGSHDTNDKRSSFRSNSGRHCTHPSYPMVVINDQFSKPVRLTAMSKLDDRTMFGTI